MSNIIYIFKPAEKKKMDGRNYLVQQKLGKIKKERKTGKQSLYDI